MVGIDDYQIVHELGHGMIGTIYLVKKDGKKYALKIEHILEKDVKKNLSSRLWREIEFAERMGTQYPDQFMKIYEHDIIDGCQHKQKYSISLDKLPDQPAEEIRQLSKSSFCSRKIYSIVTTSLDRVIDQIDVRQIYSIIIQLVYAIYLMHSNGYVHNDLHMGNIGLIRQKKNHRINIMGYNLPTYGYQVQIIDYGLVLNKRYRLKSGSFGNEKKILKDQLQYEVRWSLTGIMVGRKWDKFWDVVVADKNFDFNKTVERFMTTQIAQSLNQIIGDQYGVFFLYGLLFPTDHQKFILGKKFKQTVKVPLNVPIEDIIFVLCSTPIKQSDCILRIIDYFANKLGIKLE
jgi:serine/threonine protein kinase